MVGSRVEAEARYLLACGKGHLFDLEPIGVVRNIRCRQELLCCARWKDVSDGWVAQLCRCNDGLFDEMR